MEQNPLHRPFEENYRWQSVPMLAYKQAGSAPFKDVTRQVLFEGGTLDCQLRYFEVAPGGHTTLERHAHVHAVMVLRGAGRCLVGDQIFNLVERDLLHIPPLTWHQFQAGIDAPLGFLCMVNADRDRPQFPNADDLTALRANEEVATFIQT